MDSQDVQLPTLPDGVIALRPMRNVVLFPNALAPISMGRPKSIAAVQHAKDTGSLLGIVMQRDERIDDPGREALCDVGARAGAAVRAGVAGRRA